MNIRLILQLNGFMFHEPQFEYLPITNVKISNITSCTLEKTSEQLEELIAGNLYQWIQQSYRVLWMLNTEQRRLILYCNTIDILGERFATRLRISKEEGKSACLEMVKALALGNFIIEDIVYKMEGNWLLKYRNPELNGLIKTFIFWLAFTELTNHENAQKSLNIFMRKFAKDVDLQNISQYKQEAIFDAFMKCFFYGKNELSIFNSILQNPHLPYHEHR